MAARHETSTGDLMSAVREQARARRVHRRSDGTPHGTTSYERSRAAAGSLFASAPAIPEPIRPVHPLVGVQRPAAPATVRMETTPSGRRRVRLRDLTSYYGSEFVAQTFRAVLGREPDGQGFHHYGGMLERGWSRAEIVGRMRFSREGRNQHSRVVGLLPALAGRVLLRIPVLGYVLGLLVAVLRLPATARNRERLEHWAMTRIAEAKQDIAGFNMHRYRELDWVTDQLSSLDSRHTEALRRHQAWSQAELSRLDVRAKQLEEGLEQASAQITSPEPLDRDYAALADHNAQLEAALGAATGKLEDLDLRQAEALRDHTTRLDAMSAQWQGDVRRLDDQISQMARLTDRLDRVCSGLTDRDIQLENRLQDVSAGVRTLTGLGSRLDEASATMTTGAPPSAPGQPGDGPSRPASALTQNGDSIAKLEGQIDQLVVALARLKRDVVVQERRCAMLLEEARKRLPAPLDKEQLSVFNGEAKHLLETMYASLEDRYRGSREDIKGRFGVYLPVLEGAGIASNGTSVLDIGCGRGEWLELLREHRYQAKGVDNNRATVELCRNLGLDLAESDGLDYLRSVPDGSLGAVTGFHLIEHLPFDAVITLLDECQRALAPGGVVIFETLNPANLQVAACNFYLDPRHRNPLPSQTLAFVAEARGLTGVEVMFLHPFPEYESLRPAKNGFNAQLRELLYGPQDYAVVGRKP